MLSPQDLDKLLKSIINKEFPGVVVAIGSTSDHQICASGNLKTDSQYFIASATKLYTTALILQLVDSNKIKLSDRIDKFLNSIQLKGLHCIDDIEYTNQITIEHLLSHTSGLPDYFQAKGKSNCSLMDKIFLGEDTKWNLDQVLESSKSLGAVFPPSYKKRALYSDTNFQILGKIIEDISGESLSDNIENQICKKLGLTKTYLYQDPKDNRPTPLNYKRHSLNIPLAMTSFGPDGGIVSTAGDGIIFLRGFFEGHLFNPQHFSYLTTTWRSIFFPLKYGVGISLFRLPWYLSPFKKFPDLVGHSGLSGAFLFYCPEKKIYLSGTVNQISKPQKSFRLMLDLIRK